MIANKYTTNNLAHCILLTALMVTLSIKDVTAQFTFSGEIRPRTELRHGFKKLAEKDQEAAFFTEQRTRLVLQYAVSDYDFKLSLQDVRIWGSVSQIYKEDPSLTNIHEAWGKFKFNKNYSVKIGRQELDYDNARILGNLDWAAQARSHDMVKFAYDGAKFITHAGVAFNQDANTPEYAKLVGNYYSGVNNYKTMQYLWLHKNYTNGNLSFLLLNNGVQVGPDSLSEVRFSQTMGFNGRKKLKATTFAGEVYYQTGTDPSGKKINAWLAAVYLSRKIGKTNLTAGVDYLSGTSPGEDKNNSFTPFYGTNHKFYGFMDYFYVGNSHQNVGLVDYVLKSSFKTGAKSNILAHAHYFSAAADIKDPENGVENMSSGLGTEIDLVYNLNISKELNLKVGYSQMFATSSMEAIKGGSKDAFNAWAWAMISFKPVFIQKSKSES